MKLKIKKNIHRIFDAISKAENNSFLRRGEDYSLKGIRISYLNILQISYREKYTLTFGAYREKGYENNLLENFVLESKPDGGYNAYLYSYEITEQEKIELDWNIPLDLHERTEVIPIEINTNEDGNIEVNSIIESNMCSETTIEIIPCQANVHNDSNFNLWHECEFNGGPGAPIIIISTVPVFCPGDEDNGGPTDPGPSNPDTGGNGSQNPNDNDVKTQPQLPQQYLRMNAIINALIDSGFIAEHTGELQPISPIQ